MGKYMKFPVLYCGFTCLNNLHLGLHASMGEKCKKVVLCMTVHGFHACTRIFSRKKTNPVVKSLTVSCIFDMFMLHFNAQRTVKPNTDFYTLCISVGINMVKGKKFILLLALSPDIRRQCIYSEISRLLLLRAQTDLRHISECSEFVLCVVLIPHGTSRYELWPEFPQSVFVPAEYQTGQTSISGTCKHDLKCYLQSMTCACLFAQQSL